MIPKIVIPLKDGSIESLKYAKSYGDHIGSLGGQVEYILPSDSFDLESRLKKLKPNGVLLPGGDFAFNPNWYIEKSFYNNGDLSRFYTYLKMLEWARDNAVPFLGICAGMQVLAGFLGGKIDIVSNHIKLDSENAHKVKINEKSNLYKIIGNNNIITNSRHNEKVAEISHDIVISAMAEDGIIEAIEPKYKRSEFELGIQWHPERLADIHHGQMAIFRQFVISAKSR